MTGRALWQLTLIAALGLGALYALKPLWGALLLGTLFFLLLQPWVIRLQTRGWPAAGAITLALGLPLLGLAWLGTYLLGELSAYLPRLPEDLAQLQTTLTDMLADFEGRLRHTWGLELRLAQYTRGLDLEALLNMDQLLSSTGWVVGIALNLLLAPILAWFLLRDYRPFRDRLLARLPNPRVELGWLLYHRIAVRLQRYLRGLVMQAGILATITACGFALAGFPSALMLGLLTGVAGLVPYLGPFLAMIPPVLVLLTTPGMEPESLLHAALVILTGFGFDNLVVIPFLLAGTVNVHPALALVAVLAAGHLAGIPGMVIVIPLLGVIGIVSRTLFEGLGNRAPHAVPA